jgi:hypothetical protein
MWLLHKIGFSWSPEADLAFYALRMALVLQVPEFDRAFVVECDASNSGIDAVLHQGGRMISFFSRQIALQHAKLAAYERELIVLL